MATKDKASEPRPEKVTIRVCGKRPADGCTFKMDAGVLHAAMVASGGRYFGEWLAEVLADAVGVEVGG